MNHTAIDQLRNQIITAFASTSPSTPAELALLPEPAEGEERHLELELQGRPWTDLDRDFWLQWWPSFGSLLPASYRYYLQSLLLCSLDEPPDEWELIGGTLSVLTPRFRRLHDLGRDKRFEYQTSLLTPEQRAAVCSFLGVLLTEPEWKFRSAKALKFGWNQADHPALQQCREFYDGLHHYVYPLSEDDDRRHLIETIRDAFEKQPYPGDDQLCGSEYGDEPAEYALEFRGLDWRTLHPRFLSYHSAALSFFTDAAFAYFLPAFLIADVCGEAGSASEAVCVLEKAVPDMALVDISLVGKSGLDLVKTLKTQHPEMLILIISMHDEVVYAKRALKAGARGYVMKQEAASVMLDAIKTVLSGKIYVSAAMRDRLLESVFTQPREEEVPSVDRLSDRELEVLELIGQGYGAAEVAKVLNLSVKTVNAYRDHIKEKLSIQGAGELRRFAVKWVQSRDR